MTLLWTAAAGAPLLGAGALDFDASAILMWGVFLLAMIFATKLVIEPYLRVRQVRDERTAGSRDEAEAKARQAEEVLARYEAELTQAKRDAAAVRDSLRGQGVAEQDDVIEQARRDAARRLTEERVIIRTRVDQAKAQMTAKAESLAERMVRRVLGLDEPAGGIQ